MYMIPWLAKADSSTDSDEEDEEKDGDRVSRLTKRRNLQPRALFPDSAGDNTPVGNINYYIVILIYKGLKTFIQYIYLLIINMFPFMIRLDREGQHLYTHLKIALVNNSKRQEVKALSLYNMSVVSSCHWLTLHNSLWGVLGSAVVSPPTLPKVRGSNPSGGTVRILASQLVWVWILVCHLSWKEMPRCSDGTLNRGLVHVTCSLSNTDFKDPHPHRGREFLRAGYKQILSIREGNPHKINAKIGLTGPIPGA